MRRGFGAAVLALFGAQCAEHRAPGDAPAASAAIAASAPAPAPPSAPSAAPSAPPAAPSQASRLHVLARSLPIHAEPSLRGKPIGALAAGDTVELRGDPPRSVSGCASVRAIAPRGWVCAEGDGVTLDANDAIWLALRAHAPDYASPWPYSYGESRGARRHKTLPGVDGPAWPASVFDSHATIPQRSTVAWLDEIANDGTTWLRASDMSFVRKDRVVPFEHAPFHGVALDEGTRLPLAFFKRAPHAKYRRGDDGRLVDSKETWPRLAYVALTGKIEKHGRLTFWETREDGVWIDARDAAIVAPDAQPPEGAHPTWIEVAALQGWLVAYEDETPVFATMISAGKLGAARPDPDRDPSQPPATTPLGTYRIREKLVTATLQSDLDDGTEFVHAEVPWSQRFYDKYLLHTAYWHDQWGEGHSGGCVNLSPVDAKWLFAWTEPKVPEGWHSVRAGEGDEKPATLVVIHP
jgi:hypothetical protein